MPHQKQKLGGYTQLFGEQLVIVKDLHEFKTELLLEVKKSVKENAGQPTKKWLKTHEVRKLLGVSITNLLTLRINGILPYSKSAAAFTSITKTFLRSWKITNVVMAIKKRSSIKTGLGVEVPPAREHVRIFFDQAGFTETEAEKFFQHYESAGWEGRKGFPIRNWKTKAQEWLWEIKAKNPHLRLK